MMANGDLAVASGKTWSSDNTRNQNKILICPSIRSDLDNNAFIYGWNVFASSNGGTYALGDTNVSGVWRKSTGVKAASSLMLVLDDVNIDPAPWYRANPSADKTANSYGRPDFRHAGRCNIAWLDGHVDSASGSNAAPFAREPFGAGNEKYYSPENQ